MKNITLIIISLFLTGFYFKSGNKTIMLNSKSFNGNSYVLMTFEKNSMNFEVKKRKNVNDDFYMNANFFTPSGKEIGEVIINGKKINKKVSFGGYFYSNGGQGHVSLYKRPSNVKFCVQTKFVGIVNGKINKRVTRYGLNKNGAYRTLIGETKKGDIILIHSNNLSLVSMDEICEFGIEKGMINGILFDGGSSVDIGLNSTDVNYSFKSLPSVIKKMIGTPEPPIYIIGNFKN
jgi:exopolysaccharide biosynthesis protein